MPVEVNLDQPFLFSISPFACLLPLRGERWGKNGSSHNCYLLGDDGIDDYKKPGSASSRSSAIKPIEATKTTTAMTSQEQLLREQFRIYFPTDHTVSKSRGGRNVSCDPRVIYTARPTKPVSSLIIFLFFLSNRH